MAAPKEWRGRPQAALIPYQTFLQPLASKEEEILAEFGRLASRIATQNGDFTEAEVATAVAHVETAIQVKDSEILVGDEQIVVRLKRCIMVDWQYF